MGKKEDFALNGTSFIQTELKDFKPFRILNEQKDNLNYAHHV